METDRYGLIGALAAHRPLLISTVFAFGLTALAVAGHGRMPQGVALADYTVNILVTLITPVLIAHCGPQKLLPRLLYAIFITAALFAAMRLAPYYAHYAPQFLHSVAPARASIFLCCGLVFWFVLLRPVFGGVLGPGIAAILAAALGASGAGGFLMLAQMAPPTLIGAIVSLSLALAALVGVSVAADFTNAYARGAKAYDAAGRAAYLGAAPAVYAGFVCAGVFFSGLVSNEPAMAWHGQVIIYGVGGVALAVIAALFVSASALSLRLVTEDVAVVENHRRQDFRCWWRPIRQALPTSTALAFMTILLIVTIVGLFMADGALPLVKLTLLLICAIAAGVTFVSLRTGIFVFAALFAAMVAVQWGYQVRGVPLPSLLTELTAIAAAAALYAQIAVAWRDARSPRRNAREAAEAAMIDGVYRYLASAAFAFASFATAKIAGLWPSGDAAAIYMAAFALIGLIIAAPLMTAISAIFGRE